MWALFYRASVAARDYEAEEAYKSWQEMLARRETYGRARVDPFNFLVKGKENMYNFHRKQADECRQSSRRADQDYIDTFAQDWRQERRTR